ncbi:methyltransferase domain-containing protein [Streptomyces asoensis]|uniref:Methyltransferase domain-containing protein n=1 Tax=Streptomyces asoensis TaxID=249586 RepID=A0A6M4WZS1_9ACTN|nr:class I SAM-dependent methyltransferase [Streptomyces asoensis]QJT05051.1 methyltransferase domain-containing protein [Streptomyces asoensis]
MSVTSRYREAWEGFWREAPQEPGGVFWDADPKVTAALHLALFEPHLADPGLALVDLGCGNGTQTRYFADRFPHVVGADLSAAALDHARRADPAGQATYRLLDAVEKGAAETLHAELGDTNVYMRGVLHQCEPDDRQPLVDGIAALLGERGRVFLVELSEAARPVLGGLAQSPAGPPPKLAPIFRHGIAPGEVADDAVPGYLRTAGLTVLASGELPLVTTEFAPDGTRIELPSKWQVAARVE